MGGRGSGLAVQSKSPRVFSVVLVWEEYVSSRSHLAMSCQDPDYITTYGPVDHFDGVSPADVVVDVRVARWQPRLLLFYTNIEPFLKGLIISWVFVVLDVNQQLPQRRDRVHHRS